MGGDEQAKAIERLDAALDEQSRRRGDDDAAKGSPDELNAAVELSAANEQVAARKAWLDYLEHGT